MPDATAAKMNCPAAGSGGAESQTNGEISPAAVPPAEDGSAAQEPTRKPGNEPPKESKTRQTGSGSFMRRRRHPYSEVPHSFLNSEGATPVYFLNEVEK